MIPILALSPAHRSRARRRLARLPRLRMPVFTHFLREFAAFVGQSLTNAKTKIQGSTPTDKLSAAQLSSAPGQNMKKTIFIALPSTLLCCGGCCVAIARPRRQVLMFAFGTAFFLSSPVQMALSQGNNYEGPVGVSGIFNGNISTVRSTDSQ